MIPWWLYHVVELLLLVWLLVLVIWGGRQYHELKRLRRKARKERQLRDRLP